MWKQFYDALATIFTVLQKLERQEQEIKELRQEQKRMMNLIQRLAYEQHRSQEREAEAKRVLLLEVENQILKAKLQLSSGEKKEDREP
jgi:septal ring factor EnvC (AmiA/AmiB activator)